MNDFRRKSRFRVIRIGLTCTVALLTGTGCASLQPLPVANSERLGQPYKVQELSYSSSFRSFTYAGKALVDPITGRKIIDHQHAIETLELLSKKSATIKSNSPSATALLVVEMPYIITLGVANGILSIPVQPILYLDFKHDQAASVVSYREGVAALAQKDCMGARNAFVRATDTMNGLASRSDVYYQIGLTYACEGKPELARAYYRAFLDFSFMKYPEYFSAYDSSLINKEAEFEEELEVAENELKDNKIKGTVLFI